MSFTAKFTLTLEWFDWRLTWKDLNEDEFLNIPEESSINNMWVPILIFENTYKRQSTLLDQDARFAVKKTGNYTLSSKKEVDEIAYYKGSENSILYERDFYLTFSCEFDLKTYPFDTQACFIQLKKQHKERKFVDLNPAKLAYTGPLGMAEFVMVGYEMLKDHENEEIDINVKILMKRRVLKHILGTYLPSICILILAQVKCCKTTFYLFQFQAAIFFHKEHFNTAIPLVITSMLVMYTLEASISSKLPSTSYIKVIDIWLLYGLNIPFLILVLIILLEHIPESRKVNIEFRPYQKFSFFSRCKMKHYVGHF